MTRSASQKIEEILSAEDVEFNGTEGNLTKRELLDALVNPAPIATDDVEDVPSHVNVEDGSDVEQKRRNPYTDPDPRFIGCNLCGAHEGEPHRTECESGLGGKVAPTPRDQWEEKLLLEIVISGDRSVGIRDSGFTVDFTGHQFDDEERKGLTNGLMEFASEFFDAPCYGFWSDECADCGTKLKKGEKCPNPNCINNAPEPGYDMDGSRYVGEPTKEDLRREKEWNEAGRPGEHDLGDGDPIDNERNTVGEEDIECLYDDNSHLYEQHKVEGSQAEFDRYIAGDR